MPPIGLVPILVLVTYAYFRGQYLGEPLAAARHTLAAQGGLVTLIYARHGTARHGLTTSIVRKQVRNAHSLELGQS